MELNPFAVYLIKTGQLLCAAVGMKDNHVYSEQEFTNQLVPKAEGEELIREMNGIEIESCIMVWSVSNYVNTDGRHTQWSPPTQKLVMELVALLQKVQFWHLAEWIDQEGLKTSQFWGLRRHQDRPYWVSRPPTQQEALQDGIEKVHTDLGVPFIFM